MFLRASLRCVQRAILLVSQAVEFHAGGTVDSRERFDPFSGGEVPGPRIAVANDQAPG